MNKFNKFLMMIVHLICSLSLTMGAIVVLGLFFGDSLENSFIIFAVFGAIALFFLWDIWRKICWNGDN